jgi:hypothetical protein
VCVERRPPIIEYPALICEKPLNPLHNDARWFLLLVAVLSAVRVWLYLRELRQTREDQLLDEFKRAERYYALRRELVLFILIVAAIILLSYAYYYEFLLCAIGYQFLWAYLLVLLLVPFIIYHVLRVLTYSDQRKIALLKAGGMTHEQRLAALLAFENTQLVQIEQELAKALELLAKDKAFLKDLETFPDLRGIYDDIVQLHALYHKSKTPTGIEKDLCDRVYAIETNDRFKELAGKEPDITAVYDKLALLYHHYEDKQKLYDELAQAHEQNKQLGENAPDAGTVAAQEAADDENAKFDKPEGDNGVKKEEKSKGDKL